MVRMTIGTMIIETIKENKLQYEICINDYSIDDGANKL